MGARRGVRRASVLLTAVALLLSISHLTAQTPGEATFRVYERGALAGTASSHLTRDDEGWVVEGTTSLGLKLTVKRFIARYTTAWRPRDLTMEFSSPEDAAIIHVAFGLADGRTRTDIVRTNREAIWASNKVAGDTLALPPGVFAAYEALAGRLASAEPGLTLTAFMVPLGDIPLSVDGSSPVVLMTRDGGLDTRRWRVRFMWPDGFEPAELWTAAGRMVRLDLPTAGVSVVRDDVIWADAPER